MLPELCCSCVDGIFLQADSRWKCVGTRSNKRRRKVPRRCGEDIALCKSVQSAAKVTRKLDVDRQDCMNEFLACQRDLSVTLGTVVPGYFDCCQFCFCSFNILHADYSREFTSPSIGLLIHMAESLCFRCEDRSSVRSLK